jgi:hypothetical protein
LVGTGDEQKVSVKDDFVPTIRHSNPLPACVIDQGEGCSPKGLTSLNTLRVFLSGSFDVVVFQDANEMKTRKNIHTTKWVVRNDQSKMTLSSQ